jgi:hypothetical protein
MTFYYTGRDPVADLLKMFEGTTKVQDVVAIGWLDLTGRQIGYGRAQQILSLLNKNMGINSSGPMEATAIDSLRTIGNQIGHQKAQRILQLLWADYLRKCGHPMEGALSGDL